MKAEPTLAQLRRRPHWSCSSLGTFLNVCSLQWAFRYVYRRAPRHTSPALVLGGVFHRALTFLFNRQMDGEDTSISAITELFSELLLQACRSADPPVLFSPEEDVNSLQALGVRMLEAFIAEINQEERILGVAVPFSVPLVDQDGNAVSKPLIGEYDLVIQAGDSVVIVDWKTSARRWAEKKAHQELQPTCYLYAWQQKNGSTPVHFRYDIVTKAKTATVQRIETIRHSDHFGRLVEKVKQIERVCKAEAFIPSDQSWACADCPYGLACQSWHRERSRSLYDFRLAA
ncbi:MAG: hypothetical protein HN742_26860 [Lentisphaerae bacterium]|jgi:Holliday junction resolvase-like predicted endonuclease|nr:hypothetical protein [Lentisphaerota bacterium]MBT4818752.1 hypothetical protein [Lentisphaerota bacterium]MBT7057051.1 hypothetical protein [Lentisphaerota bacterium]MBT7845523.1 hypothetical protein [Lentisphaerota bacterium]